MVSRRKALTLTGVGVAGAVGAAAGVATVLGGDPAGAGRTPAGAIEFFGEHQAGIVTPAQDRLHFVAFDVITKDRGDLIELLRTWTAAAERMTRGRGAGLIGAVGGIPQAPPDDTGEALGLPPSGLTITIGFGTGLFRTADGTDRFGLAARKPPALADIPAFRGDALRSEISGGDLCIQACANDPQVAVHAVRDLARLGFGRVTVRYSQLGFGRTSSTSITQATPRNMLGFKDGTRNLKAEDGADQLAEHLWAAAQDGADWMAGGSYLVTRRIRMMIETWDRAPLGEQEAIIGRDKGEGAPLGHAGEYAAIDFEKKGADGGPAIPMDSHVRLAHPDHNGGAKLLRRGYTFVDGSDGFGRLDAGLFFMAYQRDPRRQFVTVQRNLARQDTLNEYIRHESSGVWACPPGVLGPQDFWGRALFT